MFSLEEDYLFILLNKIVYDDNKKIENKSASELYSLFCETAEEIKAIKDFQKKYKSHTALGKRIANMKEDLEKLFKIDVIAGRKSMYNIGPLVEKDEEKESNEEKTEGVDAQESASNESEVVGSGGTNPIAEENNEKPPEPSLRDRIDAIKKRKPKKLEESS